WETPALTTHGYQNHGLRTEKWRYIRYENGDEELYDEQNDPNEWTNLAGKSEFSLIKEQLARYLPETNVPTPRGKNEDDVDSQKKQNKAAKRAKKANNAAKQ